jgi:hypothetical protein
MEERRRLTQGRIFKFWMPLAATWLMMSVEGPFLAAVIARLPEAKYNLAAYGVAFAFALLLESPIILIMSASTALVEDRVSFTRLRAFTYSLNVLITVLFGLCLLPPFFYFMTERLMGLPANVARLTHIACILLLPWPGAIGYRRFNHGILIRHGLTRRVAYGTVVRLVFMASTALVLFLVYRLPGALVGAAALSAGVTTEAAFSRLMAWGSIGRLRRNERPEPVDPTAPREPLTYRFIWRFYYPLALTSMLTLGVNPLVTFFLGHSRMAIESLAVLPVVNTLVFLFRSMGLAFQEVGIALLGPHREGYRSLRRFATVLGVLAASGLACIAFTPLTGVWFEGVSGLSPELTRVAVTPIRILALMPALSVMLSFLRSMLVASRVTRPITWGTAIEVCGIVFGLMLGIKGFDLVGVTAAAAAFMFGRTASLTYLLFPFRKAMAGAGD